MAQKQRKTVPQPDTIAVASNAWESERAFAREVPSLAFLFPEKRRQSRLAAVKKMFSKILGGLIPALAEQEPESLQVILRQS